MTKYITLKLVVRDGVRRWRHWNALVTRFRRGRSLRWWRHFGVVRRRSAVVVILVSQVVENLRVLMLQTPRGRSTSTLTLTWCGIWPIDEKQLTRMQSATTVQRLDAPWRDYSDALRVSFHAQGREWHRIAWPERSEGQRRSTPRHSPFVASLIVWFCGKCNKKTGNGKAREETNVICSLCFAPQHVKLLFLS